MYIYIHVCVCHSPHNQEHKVKSPYFMNVSPCYLDDGWFYHEKTSYDVQNFMTLKPLNTKKKNSETIYQGSLENNRGVSRDLPHFGQVLSHFCCLEFLNCWLKKTPGSRADELVTSTIKRLLRQFWRLLRLFRWLGPQTKVQHLRTPWSFVVLTAGHSHRPGRCKEASEKHHWVVVVIDMFLLVQTWFHVWVCFSTPAGPRPILFPQILLMFLVVKNFLGSHEFER